MCGRFYADDTTVREAERIVQNVQLQIQNMRTGDIYPSQNAGILTGRIRQKNVQTQGAAEKTAQGLCLEEMHWGFPRYQKKGLLINARAETALERKMFCDSLLHRRCVIPAGHFYEWDCDKNKVIFFREDSQVLYLAGFFQRFQEEERFIILTAQANASVSPVHDRMPLILEEAELHDWVFDNRFMEYALHKTLPELGRKQEYEQQSLVFD